MGNMLRKRWDITFELRLCRPSGACDQWHSTTGDSRPPTSPLRGRYQMRKLRARRAKVSGRGKLLDLCCERFQLGQCRAGDFVWVL